MINRVSILGCGWLGLALAKYLHASGIQINASTTTATKLDVFKAHGYNPFLIDIENLSADNDDFFNSDVLIIAITSKKIDAFKNLALKLESSPIKKVLYVSSTSVYKNISAVLSEDAELSQSPLVEIEQVFTKNRHFNSTILRFSGLFNKDRHPGRFFKDGRQIPNPEAPVNMIHRDDCILIISDIIKQNKWNEIFNACADTHPSRRLFYIAANKDYGSVAPNFDEAGLSEGKEISNLYLKRCLNYVFIHPDVIDALGE